MAPELPATSSFSLHARRVQWFLTVQQFCSAIVKCLGPLDPARNGGGDDSDGAAHDGQGLLGGGREGGRGQRPAAETVSRAGWGAERRPRTRAPGSLVFRPRC